MVFLVLFTFALWCGSAWFVVRFNTVCGVLSLWSPWGLGYVDGGSAINEIPERRRGQSLSAFFAIMASAPL